MNEKLKKLSIIQSLDFLVWGSLQNYKFLETWMKMLCSIYHKTLVVDKRHAYESCEKKIVEKKQLKWMNNGWSKCVKEWHSIIWFCSYFQNAKNIRQQKLFVHFLISVAWTYPKLPIMLGHSQKNLIIKHQRQEILIKRWVLLNDIAITTCVF